MVELKEDKFETIAEGDKIVAKRTIVEEYTALEAENTMLRLRQKIEMLENEVVEQKKILSFFEKHEAFLKIIRDGQISAGKFERELALMDEKQTKSVIN